MKQIQGLSRLVQNRYFLFLALVAFLLGAFLILSSEVREAVAGEPEFIVSVDSYVLKLFFELRRPWLNGVAVDFTALGSTTVLTLFTFVFAVFMLMLRRSDLMIHIAIAAGGAGLLSVLLKSFFGRERPALVEKLVQVKGYSYPSGHSLAAAAVYLTFALLSYQLLKRNSHRSIVFFMFGMIVVLIGLSRIYLGVHYPSDVLAGILLGSSWALLLVGVSYHLKNVGSVRT